MWYTCRDTASPGDAGDGEITGTLVRPGNWVQAVASRYMKRGSCKRALRALMAKPRSAGAMGAEGLASFCSLTPVAALLPFGPRIV